MIRTFKTTTLRDQQELTGRLWSFTPENGTRILVPTPSVWETYPEYTNYRGTAVYETEFTSTGITRLEFKGVSHTAYVYVDDRYIGMHYNAFTPFEFILADLEPGRHTLKIAVDNRFSEDSALHVPNDYMTYGGINRPVVLETLNEQYIDLVHAVPVLEDGTWYLNVKVQIRNLAPVSVTLDINVNIAGQRAGKLFTMPADAVYTYETKIRCDGVTPWDVRDPHLYKLRARLSPEKGTSMDDRIERIGFRTVEIKGKQILLNGRPLLIKGFCRHEDHPEFGCALPYNAIAYDLNLILDLGGNSVRTSHYPNDEIFLDLCDELGILVWEENHARGLKEEAMRNPHFEEQAETCIREMVRAHMNHPSIYIWGILNECASNIPYGAECYKKQYDLLAELDPSRPRSSASCEYPTDLTLGFPPVVSYNMYPEWYMTKTTEEYLTELYDWVQQDTEGAGKPFLVTEIGAGALYGYRTPTNTKWSEEYQRDVLSRQIPAVLEHEGISGVYIWQFCDVRISEEWFNIRPRTMNNKGIVDEYRRRKLSYDTVKAIYHRYPDHKDQ